MRHIGPQPAVNRSVASRRGVIAAVLGCPDRGLKVRQQSELFLTIDKEKIMGGKSSTTQAQQSQTAPWEAAQPMLQGILGQLNPLI